ncbi:alpha/beta hydrolase [Alteromonadaceae bacterium M269]|nr:alpha/beta hydrolase [Alteromonadaceae bacterium M269]
MPVFRWIIATAVLMLLVVEVAKSEPYTLPNTEVVTRPKAKNGVNYQLYIHVPDACSKAEQGCKTVYLLDADYSFALSTQIVTHLSDRNRIPPVISVAIAYPDKTSYRQSRTRDYTPFFVAEGGYGKSVQSLSGGGPAFLSVLEEEIIPFVEKHYPADSQGRILVGHSYGGLFAVNAWVSSPDVFSDYIIVSASLWYGNKATLDAVKQACAKSDSAHKAKLFLAVGEYEEQPENGRAMVSDLNKLAKLMSSCKKRSVMVYKRIFEDETHASIFPAAYSTGLRKHLQ